MVRMVRKNQMTPDDLEDPEDPDDPDDPDGPNGPRGEPADERRTIHET